ncbi:MAG: hypothetical protein BECKG1743D_GA0114223_100837 [Candidatus Kentron sp. G]|nr:MAG: hypothetical protein BECKG1743F_GA0114225_100828 [Candidatus Kentron sp. G]VFM96745.1 MAG: hypothetical protein BECKG1743E_GA0114224_100827 [Candidatus Kentron sp. G]VFM98780.1 MAG: hypothetical protein BECKG1743D_GA0114223_100837 [Candidatus Kentron sp. G]
MVTEMAIEFEGKSIKVRFPRGHKYVTLSKEKGRRAIGKDTATIPRYAIERHQYLAEIDGMIARTFNRLGEEMAPRRVKRADNYPEFVLRKL